MCIADGVLGRPRSLGLTLLAATLVSSACGYTGVTQVSGPDSARCELSLGSPSADLPASAAQINVPVVTTSECAWTARSEASWIQVTPTSGQGEATVALIIAANGAQSARSGAVTINGERFQVSQAAALAPSPPPPAPGPPPSPSPSCNYQLEPSSRQVDEEGGNHDVRVITTAACAWTASSSVSWITFRSATSGSGTTTIQYRVERNRSDDSRTGIITVAGQRHEVRQRGED
jgi:hypothetical protein